MIKNHVKIARQHKGISQTELAKLTGLSQNSISSIETGQYNPTVGNALKIAKALNLKVEELFVLIKDPN